MFTDSDFIGQYFSSPDLCLSSSIGVTGGCGIESLVAILGQPDLDSPKDWATYSSLGLEFGPSHLGSGFRRARFFSGATSSLGFRRNFKSCSPRFILPLGLKWGWAMSEFEILDMMARVEGLSAPRRRRTGLDSVFLSWPGLHLEVHSREGLVAIEYSFADLPARLRKAYRDACCARMLGPLCRKIVNMVDQRFHSPEHDSQNATGVESDPIDVEFSQWYENVCEPTHRRPLASTIFASNQQKMAAINNGQVYYSGNNSNNNNNIDNNFNSSFNQLANECEEIVDVMAEEESSSRVRRGRELKRTRRDESSSTRLPVAPLMRNVVLEAHVPEPPIYLLSILALKETGSSLKYTEISAHLISRGFHVPPESVLGSLSGFYATARGKAIMKKVGKGRYELQENYEQYLDADALRELNRCTNSRKKVSVAPASSVAASGGGSESSSDERIRKERTARQEQQKQQQQQQQLLRQAQARELERPKKVVAPTFRLRESADGGATSAVGSPSTPTGKTLSSFENLPRKPYLYELAYLVLVDEGAPLHYKDIAQRITDRGLKTTSDQVLGALGGWFAHAGSEYLERTGPGKYAIKPGSKPFVPCQAEDAESNTNGTSAVHGAAQRNFRGNAVGVLSGGGSHRGASSNGAAAGSNHSDAQGSDGIVIGNARISRASLMRLRDAQLPVYQLALDVLREAGVPMHYRDISMVLRGAGRNTHQDTILGSLNGYINSPAGRLVLQRVGKGTYALKDTVQQQQVVPQQQQVIQPKLLVQVPPVMQPVLQAPPVMQPVVQVQRAPVVQQFVLPAPQMQATSVVMHADLGALAAEAEAKDNEMLMLSAKRSREDMERVDSAELCEKRFDETAGSGSFVDANGSVKSIFDSGEFGSRLAHLAQLSEGSSAVEGEAAEKRIALESANQNDGEARWIAVASDGSKILN